jgi:hypothetical protein
MIVLTQMVLMAEWIRLELELSEGRTGNANGLVLGRLKKEK